jgi:hypothetical protein
VGLLFIYFLFLKNSNLHRFLLLKQINESIGAEKSCTVRLLNYRCVYLCKFHFIVKKILFLTLLFFFLRKDGSSFWNLFHISPVRTATGKVRAQADGNLDKSKAYP